MIWLSSSSLWESLNRGTPRRGAADLQIYTQVHLPAKMPEHAGRDDGAADGTPRSEKLEEQLDLTCHPLIKHGEGLGFMGRFDRPEFVLRPDQVQIVQGPESKLWIRLQDSAGDHVRVATLYRHSR